MIKRSNDPIFWLLFGAGGMLSALFGFVLVFILGIDSNYGIMLGTKFFEYDNLHVLMNHVITKAFLFIFPSLFAWHAAHRIFHTLHCFEIHPSIGCKLLTYGVAFLLTIFLAIVLLVM